MKEYELLWQGPFLIYGRDSDTIYDRPVARGQGIYLWTIEHNDSFMVDYVGETGHSFAQRTKEHIQAYLSGEYRILDPDLFVTGIKKYIWEGLWRKERRYKISKFIDRQMELLPVIHKLLMSYRLFVAPFKTKEKRSRKRIESALVQHIKSSSREAAEFYDDVSKYEWSRWEEEEELLVRIKSPVSIIGLPKEMKI